MSETVTISGVPDEPDTAKSKAIETIVLPLAVEDAVVSKRVRRTLVRASRTTSSRSEAVEVDLKQEQVVIERVVIGRIVDAVPPVRQEGDVTIMPVVEEELVVVRRLVLKEEVHIRRVQTTVSQVETVTLRQQHVSVTRTALDD
ncbi:MAG: DUF2382 domain-containing protein [Janthinobacterium lividum]